MTERRQGMERGGGPGAAAPGADFSQKSDGAQALDAPHAARGGVALDRMLLFITWLVPVLENFPRSQRFLLGDRLQGLALDTVEALVEATDRKQPREELLRANLLLEKQRLLWRVSYNLRLADTRRDEHACSELDEVGRRIGAWLKRLAPARGAAHG